MSESETNDEMQSAIKKSKEEKAQDVVDMV